MTRALEIEILGHQLRMSQCILQLKRKGKGKSLICFNPSLQSASTRVTTTKQASKERLVASNKAVLKINPENKTKKKIHINK